MNNRPRFVIIDEGSRLALYRDVTGLTHFPVRVILREGQATFYEFDSRSLDAYGNWQGASSAGAE